MSILPVSQDNLNSLASTVRAGVAAMGCAMSDVFRHAFAVGDALVDAKARIGHGHWLTWLSADCGLSARSAAEYMRLAQHREFLEAEISGNAANLSLRGALRLIGTGRRRGRRPRSPLSILDWRAGTLEQRAIFTALIPTPELLAALSSEQRREIIDRIDGLRAAQAKPVTAVVRH